MAKKFCTKDTKAQKRNTDELDLQAIKHNLSLPPENRLKQHQSSLETVLELERAHKEIYEESK